jgi:predicted XRE-type DNA-binding protein
VIVKRGLSDAAAGATMGLSGSKVSDLRNGRTRDYSLERLYELLNNLDGER